MTDNTTQSQVIVNLWLDDIIVGDNDRTLFKRDDIVSLAESIRSHGLAQPITVREVVVDGDKKYQIVAGERRWRAFRHLVGEDIENGIMPSPFSKIPVHVRVYTDEQASAIMLAENLHRADLDPIDEAQGYQKRIDKFGWTVAQIAEFANVSVERVRKRLVLLRLMPEVQQLVRHGHCPIGHAELMGDLSKNYQLVALKTLTGSKFVPYAQFASIVSELKTQQNQMALFDLDELLSRPADDVIAQFTKKKRKTTTKSIMVNGTRLTLVVETDEDKEVEIFDDVLECAVIVNDGE